MQTKMVKLIPTMGAKFSHCICTANPATFEDGRGLDVHDEKRKLAFKDFNFKFKETQRITAFFKDGVLETFNREDVASHKVCAA